MMYIGVSHALELVAVTTQTSIDNYHDNYIIVCIVDSILSMYYIHDVNVND